MSTQTTPAPWIAYKASPMKQSNYGRYRTIVYRGEGPDKQSVIITADTPEIAKEIALNAAAAPELLAVCELALDRLGLNNGEGEEDEFIAIIETAVKKAKGE